MKYTNPFSNLDIENYNDDNISILEKHTEILQRIKPRCEKCNRKFKIQNLENYYDKSPEPILTCFNCEHRQMLVIKTHKIKDKHFVCSNCNEKIKKKHYDMNKLYNSKGEPICPNCTLTCKEYVEFNFLCRFQTSCAVAHYLLTGDMYPDLRYTLIFRYGSVKIGLAIVTSQALTNLEIYEKIEETNKLLVEELHHINSKLEETDTERCEKVEEEELLCYN